MVLPRKSHSLKIIINRLRHVQATIFLKTISGDLSFISIIHQIYSKKGVFLYG